MSDRVRRASTRGSDATVSAAGETAEVIIGVVDRPFGVRGEVLVTSLTDVPGRFCVGLPVRLQATHGRVLATSITGVRHHGERVILGLSGLESPEAAGEFRGGYLHTARGSATAREGEFFQCDLLGLAVVDEAGRPLGSVEAVLEAGGQHLFVVRQATQERLVPAVKAWVREIDVVAGRMTVRVPDMDEPSMGSSERVRHAV